MAEATARQIALAQRLILKHGRLTTFQRLAATPADPAKPWLGPGMPAVDESAMLPAVFLPASGEKELSSLAIDSELLKRVEQVLLVAGGANDLAPFSVVLDGSIRYRIDWVRTLKPSTADVLYALGIKR